MVKEASVKEAAQVNRTIPEFRSHSEEYFETRIRKREYLIIVASLDDMPAGYLIGYDRYDDGSFYCWMAGVNPAFRRKGTFTALMDYQEKWAKTRGYEKIKIKTRNSLREMLSYLVKHGFFFTEVVQYHNREDSRILLEKDIS